MRDRSDLKRELEDPADINFMLCRKGRRWSRFPACDRKAAI